MSPIMTERAAPLSVCTARNTLSIASILSASAGPRSRASSVLVIVFRCSCASRRKVAISRDRRSAGAAIGSLGQLVRGVSGGAGSHEGGRRPRDQRLEPLRECIEITSGTFHLPGGRHVLGRHLAVLSIATPTWSTPTE